MRLSQSQIIADFKELDKMFLGLIDIRQQGAQLISETQKGSLSCDYCIFCPLSLHIKSWRIIYGGLDFMTDLKRSINTGHIWDWGIKWINFTEKTLRYFFVTEGGLEHSQHSKGSQEFGKDQAAVAEDWFQETIRDERWWCFNCFSRNSHAFSRSLVSGRNRQ